MLLITPRKLKALSHAATIPQMIGHSIAQPIFYSRNWKISAAQIPASVSPLFPTVKSAARLRGRELADAIPRLPLRASKKLLENRLRFLAPEPTVLTETRLPQELSPMALHFRARLNKIFHRVISSGVATLSLFFRSWGMTSSQVLVATISATFASCLPFHKARKGEPWLTFIS